MAMAMTTLAFSVLAFLPLMQRDVVTFAARLDRGAISKTRQQSSSGQI